MSPHLLLIFSPLGASTTTIESIFGIHSEQVCIGFTGAESMEIGRTEYERVAIGFTGHEIQEISQ